MKILFIQLPLIDHQFGYINGNIDYAPAIISSFIKRNFSEIECETLPSVLSNFCTNELIVKYVINTSPDIICFTSYLWNVERNLEISEILRSRLDSVIIVFGGPEISEGSIALSKQNIQVDIFVSGEGEWFFHKFLNGQEIKFSDVNGNSVAIQPVSELLKVEDIVEPLSSKRLNSMIDGSVFLEMTRGCPYKCSYCYYSKNSKTIRELPFNILTDVIQQRDDLKEIYILSPTFDRSKDFILNLKLLKRLNHSVKLHTEIRTDKITEEIADLMFAAGFHSLEVGLQSMNKKALGNIQRLSDPEKELNGMENLVNAGVDLKIGIIPGLPGDDENSFMKTVDVLCDRGFGDFIELYPLMILPGTAIRELAIKDNVKFQNKPPYFFIEGWNFESDQVKRISSYIEEKSEMSPVVFYLPDFTESKDSLLIKGIIINGSDHWPVETIVSDVDTVVTDIHAEIKDLKKFYKEIHRFIKNAVTTRLYNIIIYSDSSIDNEFIARSIKQSETDNLYRRQNIFNSFREGSIFHFFQVTDKLNRYLEFESVYSFIIPALFVNEKSAETLLNSGRYDIPLVIDKGMYNKIKNYLLSGYAETPEYIAFKCENDMQMFYKDTNTESLRYPYNFGLKVYK